MSSSTFSSEYVRAYLRLPRRTRLWHAGLVIGGLLTAGLCLDRVRESTFDPRWRVGDARVLCVGTSRIRDGLRPEVFRRPTGKVTYPGLDQATATAAIMTHLELWPALEVVIIGLDEFSLLSDAVHLHRDNLSDICGALDLRALDLDAQIDGEDRWTRHAYRWRNFLAGTGAPSLHHRRRWSIANALESRRSAPRPHRPRIIGAAAARSRIQYARKEMFSPTPETAVRRNAEALVQLVAGLRRRGIAVVVLCPPCSKAYEAERPAGWDRCVDDAVALVRARLGTDACEVWDYRGDARATNAWFADVDHLGPVGSQEFSALVADRVAAAGWLGPRAAPR